VYFPRDAYFKSSKFVRFELLDQRREKMSQKWVPPPNWTVIKTIDAHTAGEPLRIILEGIPVIPGQTILEKRCYAQEHLDHLRKAIVWEPRGHADMYACILTEPVTPDGRFGVLFLHNQGFSTMCGHGIIGLTKVVLETGLIERIEGINLISYDTPAGRVTAKASILDGRIQEISFLNVPSFVFVLDQRIDVPGLGRLKFDIAFGGAFYAFCDAQELGLKLIPEEAPKIVMMGKQIRQAVEQTHQPQHPFEPDLSFLYGTIFTGPPQNSHNHSRHVCIFADGELDRSPTGTGVSARAALIYARNELEKDESFTVESILGTSFKGQIVQTLGYKSYEAVVPEITGSAYIIGRNEFYIDPDDPLGYGFLLG
jgi:proline racemase